MTGQDSSLENYREKIDHMVGHFQRQTSLPLWIFAHSDAVKAAAFDLPFHFGPRGRVVHWVFNRTGRTIASLAALWMIGFAVIVKWWLRAALSKPVLVEGVLVGIGAGSEEQLFGRLKAELAGRAYRVNHDAPRTFGCVSKPPLRSLLKHLWAECRKVYTGLRLPDQSALANSFTMWMTVSAMRVASYAFVKTWAEQLPPQVKRVVFIAADIQCFAAIDGRRPDQDYAIEYWQHGLHYRSLLIPPVDRILALNHMEGRHMHRLCKSPFELLYESEPPVIDRRTATLLFASIYSFPGFDKERQISQLNELFSWAQSVGLTVVVRPHPREEPSFWLSNFPTLQIDQSAVSFPDCIERWRPSLVVSWFSTALLDALRLGVAPVLLTEGSVSFLRDMVFPLYRVALRWPEELETIENITRDQAEYQRWITRRWEDVFVPNGAEGVSDDRDRVTFQGSTP